MRFATLLLLAAVACGGKTSGTSGPPAPGTSACDDPSSGVCVMCDDGKYHCGAGGAAGAADAAYEECTGAGKCGTGHPPCVNCSMGVFCTAILNPGGDNDIETTAVAVTCQ